MDTEGALGTLRQGVDAVREEYVVAGRGDEFDDYVARLRSEGRWPFED